MKIDIKHFSAHYKELDTIRSFLDWHYQKYTFSGVSSPEVMKKTRGTGGILITINGDEIIGFKGLVKYWNEKGLWLI